MGAQVINFDVNFLRPFIDGTIETLKVQCSSHCAPMKPFLRGQSESTRVPDVEIAALIGIYSSAFQGSMALCFPKNVFLHLMNGMMGENYTELTPEIQDGAAELCNIIFGLAKQTLNNSGHDVKLAIPSIVTGSDLQPIHSSTTSVVIIPFTTDKGIFCIEICGQKIQAAS